MAATDETIDPNDLDSIDALLDEAELEVAENEGASGNEETFDNEETSDNEGQDQEVIDSLLDEISLPGEVSIEEQEEESVEGLASESDMESTSGLVEGTPIDLDKKQQSAIKKSVSSEEAPPLVQPEVIQPNPTKEMTAEDMDSIKKLIIIFGSILVVLALIGIGIGVWSVFAAKGAAMDEETKTLIESTQVSTERMAGKVMDSNESIRTIEKKIDALNFQLEELSADLLEVQTPVSSAKKHDIIDPLGLNTASAAATPKTKAPVVAQTAEHSRQSGVETAKLASSVNKKMIAAQRRMDEVNRRVKDIQSKHKALLLSIKNLEKQLVLQQKKVAEKEQAAKVKKQGQNPYQYSAPDATYYDQSVGDSYP